MPVNLDRLPNLREIDLSKLTERELKQFLGDIAEVSHDDRQQNQLLTYQPASPEALKVHQSMARVIGVGGGNGSGKTDTVLAEICALATGTFPPELREDFKKKFRGPVRCRIVIESLTTVLEPTILPKFQFWKWSGVGDPGSDKGHWGWIPKNCLKDGSWEKSWKDKTKMLTVLCRDPENNDKILGESIFQFMSHDQDPTDFASGDFHHVMHDEPPREAIWIENEARTMRVRGRLYLSMTWPDDPAIAVDWIHDKVYERGCKGPMKMPDYDWFELWTTNNRNLDQTSISTQMKSWSEETRKVRIYGQPIRFSNRIHPLFTDTPMYWSFPAGRVIVPEVIDGVLCCPDTGSTDILEFCHVQHIEPSNRWPTIMALDPHPRKPHMGLWAQVLPDDDLHIIDEFSLDADPTDLKRQIFEVEEAHGMYISDRIMDPNMGASPASSIRHVTWQSAFDEAGLNCTLADDSDVGRARLNEYLKPDRKTLRPRIIISPRCQRTIFQLKRYVWDNYRRQDERDLKQKPKDKYDDYPTLLKYLLNMNPSFAILHRGAPVIRNHRSMQERKRVRV